jgi:hypothetical protein
VHALCSGHGRATFPPEPPVAGRRRRPRSRARC